MITISDHGGRCCGVDHIWSFGYYSEANVKSFKDCFTAWKRRNSSRLLEACLTDAQMRSGWAKVMKDSGFKLVNRFKNSNSQNVVNVLHFCSAKPWTQTARGNLPQTFEW